MKAYSQTDFARGQPRGFPSTRKRLPLGSNTDPHSTTIRLHTKDYTNICSRSLAGMIVWSPYGNTKRNKQKQRQRYGVKIPSQPKNASRMQEWPDGPSDIHLLSGWSVDRLVGWLVGWLIGWLVGRSVGRSVGRLVICLFVCLFVWLVGFFGRYVDRKFVRKF